MPASAAHIYDVFLAGLFVMASTIFALTLRALGGLTKAASSLLVMAIIGGAILPAGMGYISDQRDIQLAFAVPLVAYALVLYFAPAVMPK